MKIHNISDYFRIFKIERMASVNEYAGEKVIPFENLQIGKRYTFYDKEETRKYGYNRDHYGYYYTRNNFSGKVINVETRPDGVIVATIKPSVNSDYTGKKTSDNSFATAETDPPMYLNSTNSASAYTSTMPYPVNSNRRTPHNRNPNSNTTRRNNSNRRNNRNRLRNRNANSNVTRRNNSNRNGHTGVSVNTTFKNTSRLAKLNPRPNKNGL